MPPRLEIRVFGPFGLRWSDGRTVVLTSRKAQALLAYLAIEGRSTRDALMNLLWGELGEERARHNLRQALSAARSTCGPIVVSDGALLSLDPQHCSADVLDFGRLLATNDQQRLEQGLGMYHGELLDGLTLKEAAFEDWLRLARMRIRDTACEAMDRFAELLLKKEDYAGAIAALNRRLSVDPACEPAHRALMVALDRVGRRSEALRQYSICADALRRELAAAPSLETRALFERIRDTGVASPGHEQRPGPPEPHSPKPRVAILPFANQSAAEDDYFVDGIVEDIITALSRFHSLQVIARGSSFVYKNTSASDQEIAEALGAGFLVRGSVQRSGDRIRLNVQLMDGPAGLTLWGDRFEFEMTDVFLVQDRISATLVSTLAGRVEAAQIMHTRKADARRLQAYDYLLRGKDHHHRFTADDCATCIEMFNRAIECEPDYAVAHAWLACGLGQAMVWGLDEMPSLVDQAQAAAERGLELDENESECHRILAQVHLTRGNLARSLKHQERALFLNPNDDRSVCSMGEILSYCGRHDEAERWVRKSMQLNPYHPQRYLTHLGRALLHLQRYGEALEVFEQIGRPRMDDHAYTVAASVLAGNQQAVQRSVDALRVDFPDFDVGRFVEPLPYERAADRKLVRDALDRAGL